MNQRRFDNPPDDPLRDMLQGRIPDVGGDGLASTEQKADSHPSNAAAPERSHFRKPTDQEIAAVMRAVDVPAGLADRILARLAREETRSVSSSVSRTPPRRLRWAVATVVAISVGLFFGGLWRFHAPNHVPLDVAAAPEAAIRHFDHDAERYGSGQLVSQASPPENFPLSVAIAELPTVRWRFVHDFLGRQALAYDLTDVARDGFRATLFVVRHAPPDWQLVPDLPPARPNLQTRNRSVTVWQERACLYVLVSEGESHGNLLLPPARGPWTWQPGHRPVACDPAHIPAHSAVCVRLPLVASVFARPARL